VARLDEEQLERLRTLTVEVILALRGMYLREYGGSVAMKHWEHLQTRALSAARRSANPDEWVTLMLRGLRLLNVAPSKACSRVSVDLGALVREMGAQQQWLDMVEREIGLLMAMSRLAAEKKQEERDGKEGDSSAAE
jgi:hypothetical protein